MGWVLFFRRGGWAFALFLLLPALSGCGGGGSSGKEIHLFPDPADVTITDEVRQSTPESFSGSISINGLAGYALTEDGTTYHRIALPDSGFTGGTGEPEVPFLVRYFSLPGIVDSTGSPEPVLQVEFSDPVVIRDVLVHPAQPPPLDQGPLAAAPTSAFFRDDAVYSQDLPYPGKTFETERIESGPLSLIAVRLYPVDFFPSIGQVRVFRKIDVSVNFNPGGDDLETLGWTREEDGAGTTRVDLGSPLMNILSNAGALQKVSTRWIPPPSVAGAPVYDDPLYHILIITAPEFASAGNLLASHKRNNLSWRVKLVDTEGILSVMGTLSASSIREYVRAEWKGNGMLWGGDLGDPDDPEIPQGGDLGTVKIYRKQRDGATDMAVRASFYGSPTPAGVMADFNTDRTGGADYRLETEFPFSQFSIFAVNESDIKGSLVYTGNPSLAQDALLFEFPWREVLGSDRVDLFVTASSSSPAGTLWDMVPDSAAASVSIRDGVPSPRYLVLLGDAEHIPVAYSTMRTETPLGIQVVEVGSDHPYADLEGDPYPDIAVGRLSADTAEEASHIVNKIVHYETHDPFAEGGQPRAAVAGQFQDYIIIEGPFSECPVRWENDVVTSTVFDLRPLIETLQDAHPDQMTGINVYYREWGELQMTGFTRIVSCPDAQTIQVSSSMSPALSGDTVALGTYDGREDRPFVRTAEKVRDYLTGQGVSVSRLYAIERTDRGFFPFPRRLVDRLPLPSDLAYSIYPWDADSSDVTDVFNSYENLLILHRDHGAINTWGMPAFSTSHMDGIALPSPSTPRIYPVVFSINCSSGHFDNETDGTSPADLVNFAERLIRMQGGAAAVVAPTRDSASWKNDLLVDGFMGSMYPDYLSGFGHESRSRVPLGDVLNFAKVYTGARLSEDWRLYYLHIFHVIGDPSMMVWRFPTS